MPVYYCLSYKDVIIRIDKSHGVLREDPDDQLHPCFTRSKGYNRVCSALMEFRDDFEISKLGARVPEQSQSGGGRCDA